MGSMKDLLGDTPYLERKPEQLVRRSDPATSHAAATKIVGALTEIQARVLSAMRSAGRQGLTDYELEEACGSHGSTFRTRRAELVEAKLVVDSGATRINAGSKRVVWIAAEFANDPIA